VIVNKKDGWNRICVDYCRLNMATIKDNFPLPDIRDLVDKLAGQKWFTTLNVLWGYHNVPMHTQSIEKTAFLANDELLEFTGVPLGLSHASATFQSVMLTALAGKCHISCTYLDFVSICGKDLKTLPYRTDLLHRTCPTGVKLKPRKCEFRDKIQYQCISLELRA
jgi:hypothetical protein